MLHFYLRKSLRQKQERVNYNHKFIGKVLFFFLARSSRNFCYYEFGKIVDFGMTSVKFSFWKKRARACIWNFSN